MTYQMRDIEYFAEVAERRNVGRAAEALGLSQPALSKSLRRLESSMQTKLIRRLSKGVELTAAGNELYSHVQRLRLSLDDMTRAVADLTQGRTGHLRIRAGPGTGSYVVPLACAMFLREAPGVTFTVTETVVHDKTMQLLRNGELDLAISIASKYVPKDLSMEHLYDESYEVYASRQHALAKRKRITLVDLAQEHWTLSSGSSDAATQLKRTFLDAGLPPPHITMESTSMLIRMRLLASSSVLAFIPRIVAHEAIKHHSLVQLRVPQLKYVRRIGVYYRSEAYLPSVNRRFIQVLIKTARESAPAVT